MAKTKHAKTSRSPLVAIVEDDAALREATEALLASAGFATSSFSAAQQFLDSPLCARTRCLILDMQLPDMSGLQLQERMAAAHLNIPTILVTAAADPEGRLRGRALRTGVLAVLRKPFDAEQLLAAVRAALGRKRR